MNLDAQALIKNLQVAMSEIDHSRNPNKSTDTQQVYADNAKRWIADTIYKLETNSMDSHIRRTGGTHYE